MSDAGESPAGPPIGGVRFDPESGDLVGPGGRGRLAPQPALLLSLLVERRGSVVTRDEIAAHLWPHGSVEIDQGIGYAMREIRKGIEAAGGDAGAIETLPRRGFRVNGPDEAAPNAPGAAAVEPGLPSGSRSVFGVRGLIVAAAVSVALVAALVDGRRAPAAEDALPVVVIHGHATPDDPAGMAMAEQLGAELTTRAFEEFRDRAGIVGPTGASGLAGPDDVEGARARLGACMILSGDLRVAPDTGVVVFSQIVRTSDRVHVWASTDTVPGAAPVPVVVRVLLAGIEEALPDCRPESAGAG